MSERHGVIGIFQYLISKIVDRIGIIGTLLLAFILFTFIIMYVNFDSEPGKEVYILGIKYTKADTKAYKQAAEDKVAATKLREQAAEDKDAATQLHEQAAKDKAAATKLHEQAAKNKAAATQLREQAAKDKAAATKLLERRNSRLVRHSYSYCNERGWRCDGVATIRPGGEYVMYRQPGGRPNSYDLAKCIVTEGGLIRAYNKDSASDDGIFGGPVRGGCSRAPYDRWIVECCAAD